ncbi:hypothetical protein ACHAXN_010634 [Cyclotella atomus]
MNKPRQQHQPNRRHRIAMVSDFFYPRLGGVEMHIWSLSHALLRLGHKVVVITHAYNCPNLNNADTGHDRINGTGSNNVKSKRTGVRYLPGGLKVYYIPFLPMVDEDCLPTFTTSLPIIRWILIREGIEIVHAHQATSTLANEAVVYAAELGLASVYTDHSLFGFDDVAGVVLNRVLKATMSTVSGAICVSHTCRDNFILRAHLPPSIVHVIPNAVDPSKFVPDPSKRREDRITIVIISRLVYRKGIDLLTSLIPPICHQYPQVHFLIGGDGPKKLCLEEMVEKEHLEHRIQFLGCVPHSQVNDVLVQGHVFLNVSLTESFCIAILEAASAGLYVVSTNVGGVPEVLPEDMVELCEVDVDSLVGGLGRVIEKIDGSSNSVVDPWKFHERIKDCYSWERVAVETVDVYDLVYDKSRLSLLERLRRYKTVGGIAGYVVCLLGITLHFVVLLIEWWQPRHLIDVVPDLQMEKAVVTTSDKKGVPS